MSEDEPSVGDERDSLVCEVAWLREQLHESRLYAQHLARTLESRELLARDLEWSLGVAGLRGEEQLRAALAEVARLKAGRRRRHGGEHG